MRVFGRVLVLAGLICACAPAAASAAPILGPTSVACTGVVAAAENCGSLAVDPFAAGAIEGEFAFLNDVALFTFTLAGDTLFSARTTSYATSGFDSTFGIFSAIGNRSLVAFPDGSQFAHSTDINPDPDPEFSNYDDQLTPFVLSGGSYILALVMYPNDFRSDARFGLADSLLAGFQSDADEPASCAPSCAFSLDIDAVAIEGPPPSERVPEPGTLTLVVGGVLAMMVRRRGSKRT